jgi:glycosyltransferase involved in cell wall biosynthesis
MSKKPLFSICLITRDEEATLPRLINSLKEFFDRDGECVILDTGSKDKTVQIAKDAGCVVEEAGDKYLHTIDKVLANKINKRFVVDNEEPIVKGEDKYFDFSAARNASANLSTNKWVSFADSDEVFTNLDIDKINEIIKSSPDLENFEYEFVFSHKYDGSPAIQFIQSKFYNKEKLKWKNLVHECLFPV